jgi:hypothetical protein
VTNGVDRALRQGFLGRMIEAEDRLDATVESLEALVQANHVVMVVGIYTRVRVEKLIRQLKEVTQETRMVRALMNQDFALQDGEGQ